MPGSALLIVDFQKAFDDPVWGRRSNPACEANIAELLAAWRGRGEPVVFVRHDGTGTNPTSLTLAPGHPGNALKDELAGEPDLLVTKQVNSAFHGDPDLAAWLRERGIHAVTVCGIQTQMCCETSARVGANLGFGVTFAIDATATFDLPAYGGGTLTADELMRVSASNIADEFGTVATTEEILNGLN